MVITKYGLVEELQTIVDFCYRRHHDDFLVYCNEKRNGKQSFEHMSMLVKSVCGRESLSEIEQSPWRFIVSHVEINELKAKLKEHVGLALAGAGLINKISDQGREVFEG